MIEHVLKLTIEEIKNGYAYQAEQKCFRCLICGKVYEVGEVFAYNGRFFAAERAIQLHINEEHGSMLELLAAFDKKYTGITENQKEILTLFHEGLSDNDIANKTGVSPATVRHQRYQFREKAKQAKLYLSIFELVDEAASAPKTKHAGEELIEIHEGARMVDDRYFITKEEEEKILASAFTSLRPLKLKQFSPKEKKKIVVLRKIAEAFEKGKKYSEKEVNGLLKPIHEDYATIRRYLIEYGFMKRTNNCKEYWLS